MKRSMRFAFLATLLVFGGCQRVYYGTMEKLGYQKRHILVSRVQDARDAQQEAVKQFASALEQFRTVVNFQEGDLERIYRHLQAEFDRSESRAQAVRGRIESVQEVAQALFREWKSELSQYTDKNLRRLSQERLNQTQQRYTQMIAAMQRAESRIEPVLAAFRDQVLFLKHNLNAQAIAALQDELTSIQTNVAALIQEMKTSIAEATAFIEAMSRE
ncbi:MAG: DUF2959 domain-containing protein [Planctomycetes bacterium]|nr:DUF2959 domain-containing protein [Planctomycetota bacterium]